MRELQVRRRPRPRSRNQRDIRLVRQNTTNRAGVTVGRLGTQDIMEKNSRF